MNSKAKKYRYTCASYREEMILLALKRKLNSNRLSDNEHKNLLEEIRCLESKMNLD